MRALEVLTHDQMEAVWWMMMEMGVTGPWKAAQLDGFGADRFIINENAPHFKIVAELKSGIGSFAGDQFVAWCRDGVPRLLLTLEQVMPSIEQTRAEIEKIGKTCRMWAVTREGFVEILASRLGAAGIDCPGKNMHHKMFSIPGTVAVDTESCRTLLDDEFGAKATTAALEILESHVGK
jgi:hypothetical protein